MTPQLQQAIKLLQLSRAELVDTVREELLENPVLEDSVEVSAEQRKAGATGEDVGSEGNKLSEHEAERIGETELPYSQSSEEKSGTTAEVKADTQVDAAVTEFDWETYLESQSNAPPMPTYRPASDDLPSIESTLSRGTSLFGHLEWQLQLTRGFSPEEEAIAVLIIGNITPDGYLDTSVEAIADEAGVSVELVEKTLKQVQKFDPPGVAARNLQECLLIQARYIGADDDLLLGMIEKHLTNLEKKNYAAIAKDMNQPLEEVYEAAKVIMAFDPKPGSAYTDEEPNYITPDVFIQKVGDKYFVVANDDGLPKLKVSDFYRVALSKGTKAREYIQERLRSAQWLIRSIQQRQRTIVRVTESILRFQREFFDKGAAYLRPLILRDVADEIGMHESTVSRVTTNKYVHTPQGLFELKYFFNSGIARSDGDDLASEAVKLKIKQIVAQEDARHPHSDQKIVELLGDQNINIARRTIAKYREQLKILPSSKRKQVF
jgi:RNA polymerase sigma-54 factor